MRGHVRSSFGGTVEKQNSTEEIEDLIDLVKRFMNLAAN